MLYLRLLPAAKTLRKSASAFTVFRGTRKLATIDGAELREHRSLTAEERASVQAIATEGT